MFFHAFRETWDQNWFQGLSALLEPLPSLLATPQPSQASRILFYSAFLSLTRMIGGEIWVATQQIDEKEVIVSAMAWLPPYKRVTARNPWALYQSGYLRLMYLWGWRGIYRVLFAYDSKMNHLYYETLAQKNIQSKSCAKVQLIGTDPKHAGHGYGTALLKHKLDKMDQDSPSVPIILDTATPLARKMYARAGFRDLGEIPIAVGECDAFGLTITSAVKETNAEMCLWKMWAMLRPAKTSH